MSNNNEHKTRFVIVCKQYTRVYLFKVSDDGRVIMKYLTLECRKRISRNLFDLAIIRKGNDIFRRKKFEATLETLEDYAISMILWTPDYMYYVN